MKCISTSFMLNKNTSFPGTRGDLEIPSSSMNVSSNRRSFLQTAGLAAGAAIAPRTAEAGNSIAASATIDTEVLVCGGGCAGLAAALSSARNGVKTVLIERAGFAGGIITAVGLPYF